MESFERDTVQSVYKMLGFLCADDADERTTALVCECLSLVENAARPASVYRVLRAVHEQDMVLLPDADVMLAGADVCAHLERCEQCALLALTLGSQIDALLRSLSTSDVAKAAVCDFAASALCEQYAAALERGIRETLRTHGMYVTSRFSPGYGDLPLGACRDILAALDAQKRIGVSTLEGGTMVPRKSVCAVCGISSTPVNGRLAGCEHCALKEKCKKQKGAALCEN